jgi:DNA-binding response OmpR family regulator
MARTILVVDDSESLRTMVKSYLAQKGFRVMTAVNGRHNQRRDQHNNSSQC